MVQTLGGSAFSKNIPGRGPPSNIGLSAKPPVAVSVKIPIGPSYQVPFSEGIRKATGILTGAVGMITDAAQAESILSSGQADVVIMARELLRDPYFPLHAANELEYKEIHWPVQYERAKKG